MKKGRKTYSKSFKQKAVELVLRAALVCPLLQE